jgi:tetratricopeptide (TPR) repeat protein
MIRLLATIVLTMVVAAPARAQSVDPNGPWAQCLDSNPNNAIAGCTKIIETHVDTPAHMVIVFNNRGRAYASQGKYDQAIEDYNEAIRRGPDYGPAFNNRGNAYLDKGDYDRAIADFSTAIGLKPSYVFEYNDPTPFNYPLVFNNRGAAYSRKGDYDRAIADFSEAIRRNPAYAEAFDNRGVAYSNKHDYDRAIADFSSSLRLNPKDAYALYGRGVAKQEANDISGANIDISAAKQIDPDAARFVKFTTFNAADAIPPAQSPSQATRGASATPACEVASDSARSSQSNHYAPSYVDDSIEQLKKEVPALRAIRPSTSPSTTDGTGAAPDQSQSASILSKTGADIAAQFKRMPNLIAKEEVKQPTKSLPGPDGSILPKAAMVSQSKWDPNQPVTPDSVHVFSYRLVPREDATSGHFVDEYRLDAHNQPVSSSSNNPDSPRSVGFAAAWLLFLPANLQESHFRYLGQQKIQGRETHVLAFAQIPGRIRQGTIIDAAGGSCSTLIQGIVWIDQSTYRIVRLQTDLLWPLPGIHLNQLRAVLNYSEVKIPQRDLLLWLPSDVETSWQTTRQTGGELHTYSNYRLFGATSRILLPDQGASQ